MNNSRRIWVMLLVALLFFGAQSAMAGTIKGKVKIKRARNSKDVVVYIDKVDGKFKLPSEHPVMDQKNLVFTPHVLPIVKGTTVDFLNSDNVLHNVFCPDECADKMNLGSWSQGKVRSYTFKEAGCVAVMLCNVHAEMEAYVVVLQNPYFCKTDKNGRCTIANVPAGTYTLKVWHKRAEGPSQEVTVPQKGEVAADFEMKRRR